MSLTGRLVLRALLVMVLVVGGVTALTYELVLVSGRNDVDDLLRQESALLSDTLGGQLPVAAGLDGMVSGPEAERAARQALAIRPSGSRHVSLVHVNGVRLQSTGGPAKVAALMRGDDAPASEPGVARTVDTGIGQVRVLDTPVNDAADEKIAVLTVAAPLDAVHDTAATVLLVTALAGGIGVGSGGVALWLVVRRTLAPVREVSAAAKGISPTDLTTRVPVPGTADEIAELATEINRMLTRIEEADTGRRRYLAAVSHEVRTPLAIAEGHLELLGGPEAETVHAELERLRRVLEDLMAVARGGDGIDADRGPVFLPDLFDAVRARVGSLAFASSVVFHEPSPQVVLGDQARLEQCLMNLVSNAIDHNPPGVTVDVTTELRGDTVALAVGDDGPGIGPELLPRVFEPFVTTRSNEAGGLVGLGLSIVRSLVEAQGGSVDIESGPGGSTVRVLLPLAKP
jgi:two-component system, OmpR family, sensor kinase